MPDGEIPAEEGVAGQEGGEGERRRPRKGDGEEPSPRRSRCQGRARGGPSLGAAARARRGGVDPGPYNPRLPSSVASPLLILALLLGAFLSLASAPRPRPRGLPQEKAGRLDCASCHQPDASGAFMQRVSFEKNCRVCHSLNIDETTPGLELPHGDATFVRAFLRSLPTHYADHARTKLGLTSARDIDAFVKNKMSGLRERTLSGENLERSVFFADASTGEATVIAGVRGIARARFAGCAYCHEVVPQGDATPKITVPQTPDRWLPHAAFNHAKHTAMACVSCHAATTSHTTADIILPSQQSCVACHSPKGGAGDSCMTCHNYHNSKPAGLDVALKAVLAK